MVFLSALVLTSIFMGYHKSKRSNKYNFKVGLSLPKKTSFTGLNESPLKMTKNAFDFILKAIFVLKVFKFLYWLFDHVKNGLIGKIRLISKFMTSQPGYQTVTIHILLSISWSKDNHTMKFDQVIEYNKIDIFLEKSCRRWGRKTISRPLFVF